MVWRDQGMVGDLALADQVLDAGQLVREDRRDQVLRFHARELRRHLPAAAEPRQRERHASDPAPARDEHRRIEQRLDQQRPHARRMQVARHLGQLEAVRRGERQHDVVLGRRRLQLEVELAAEALAQRQPPGAVEAAAVGRMDDQLHAARLVEEALEHERVLRRQAAERRVRRGQVVDQLGGGRLVEPDLLDQPAQRAAPAGSAPGAPRSPPAGATPRATARRCGPAPRPARTGWSAACRARPRPGRCRARRAGSDRRCCRAGRCRRAGSRRRNPRSRCRRTGLPARGSPGSRRCPGSCRRR